MPRLVQGRYALHGVIGAGGMATVHVGRRYGAEGFRSTVAIKRLTPDLAEFPSAMTMLADEARIASRVQHANVVPVHDVVVEREELFLVMEHVMGVSLAQLIRASLARKEPMPAGIVRGIVVGVLRGLDAAHEAKDDEGRPLGIIHRDVSPSNVLVGVDGIPRLVDFGIAKARDRATQTLHGEVKGKLGFMAPEQVRGAPVDRRTDVYSVGVIYWESLVQKRLFKGDDADEVLGKILHGNVAPPSTLAPSATPEDDAIVRKALRPEPDDRYASAAEMAAAIEKGAAVAPASEIAAYVADVCAKEIEGRKKLLDEMRTDPPILWIGAEPSFRRSADVTPPVTGPPPPPAPPKGSLPEISSSARWPYALAAIGGGSLLVVLVFMFRPPTTAPPPTVYEPVPVATSAAPPETAAPTAPPAPTADPPPPPPRPKVVIPKPHTKPASCNPPFVIDSHGVKLYKEECLR